MTQPSLAQLALQGGNGNAAVAPAETVSPTQQVQPSTAQQPAVQPGLQTSQQAQPSPAPETPAIPPAAPSGTQPQASVFAAAFRNRGFDVGNMTDDEVLDAIESQIDNANRILDEQKNQSSTAQPTTNSTVNNALPAQPATGVSSSVAPVTGESKRPQLSPEASALAQQGLITRGEDGFWSAKNPHLQPLADEHSKVDAFKRATIATFAADPEQFIRQQLQQVTAQNHPEIEAMKAKLEAMETQFTAQKTAQQLSLKQQWVQENAASLYSGGTPGGALTPFGEQYNAVPIG